VAPSASSAAKLSPVVLGLTVAVGLSGCVTTQQKSARAALVAERTLASRKPVKVTTENPSVRVSGIATVRGSNGSGALVVRLRNVGSKPLNDLPISVGTVTRRDGRTYLNGSHHGALGYFETHIAAIGAHATTTWMFLDRHLPTLTGHLFALVGRASSPASTTVATLPAIAVTELGAPGSKLRLSVVNHSQVPQYGFPVYALAIKKGRLVAVGRATVTHLGTLGHTNLDLRMLGDASGAAVHGYALPTIFE
jgi:hypothetical protein